MIRLADYSAQLRAKGLRPIKIVRTTDRYRPGDLVLTGRGFCEVGSDGSLKVVNHG